MAANGNDCGYAITAQNFFAEIGLGDRAPNEQAVSKARQKLHWGAFEYLLREANQEDLIEELWRGHRVRIVDGTKLSFPNYREIREHFAIPNTKAGPGHYPQGWMVTLINSTSGQPVAMELGCGKKSSERKLMLKMLPHFKPGDIALLDRGLGGAQVYLDFIKADIHFIHRVKTSGNRVAIYVQEFLKSKKASQITCVPALDDDGEEVFLWVRLVRGPKDSEGKRIVFATSLIDEDQYPSASIRELYRQRWAIETMYGRIKNILHIGKFHARSFNGIMQEIYAHLLVISLTALIEVQASRARGLDRTKAVPSFKAATHVIRRHLASIVGGRKLTRTEADHLATKMVEEAGRILWRKQPGRSFPRVSKQPISSWNLCKNRKLAAAGRPRRRRAA
jgi:Transposase DDE domain